ncbi:MAG: hypothetical protein ACI4J1_04605 [Ruminiclostridium sp.]
MKYKLVCDDGMVIYNGELNGAQLAAIQEIVESPNCSVDCFAVVNNFNTICTQLAKVCKVTPSRKKSIENAAKNFDLDAIFRKVAASPFLCGNNGRNWRADFDWILKPNNLIQIFEGKYDVAKPANDSSFDIYNLDDIALQKYAL